MVKTLRLARPRGLVTAVVATAFVAAACGSSTADTVVVPAADESTDTAEASGAGDSAAEDAAEAAPDAASDDTSEEAADESAESAPVENLFPNIDVVSLDDGSTVNLAAQLGGGDLPVLLWFWAPH